MSNLVLNPNGSEKSKQKSFNTLPGFSSWIDDILNANVSNELISNFNTGITLPAVNIKDTADNFLVEMAIPGLKKSDFDISLDNYVLSISAETKTDNEEENNAFTRREFGYSSFKRTFSLPDTVDTEKISAKYNDGLLVVELPKREEAKKKPAKRIKIS